MISRDTIQTILETARVEEVVGEFVNLRKRGVNMIGLCPFHNEKTPSFTVSPPKGIFKCFGCGKAGNAVNFVMEHEHYTYPEALRYIARKYNIEIEEEEQTPEQIQDLNEKESLYAVSTFAQKFFTDQLFHTEEGKAIGLSYFKSRDLREHTIEQFQLGYSPDSWDAFTRHAFDNGFKQDYLVKSGMCIEKNGKTFDRFNARVIFPIHNLSGRVIGFGGRILKSDEKKAKYINSPESDIYNKSQVLYGLYFAKNAIIKKDNCFLVEGYTDVISLFQAGFENVVASSGTSLTTDQIRLIKRYTPNITILYDGDEAGLKASFRGIDMILEQGMNVKIVMFPQGEDPDSFVRSHRSMEVEEFLHSGARDFIQFKTNILLQDAKNDPVKKAGLIKEIVQSISVIPDQIMRSVYVKECSVMMEMAEQTLMNELNKMLRKKLRQQNLQEFDGDFIEIPSTTVEKQVDINLNDTEYQERDVIRLLLNYGNDEIDAEQEDENGALITIKTTVAGLITNDLKHDEITFSNSTYQKIFDDYADLLENEEILPNERYFINHPNKKVSSTAIDLLTSPYELSDNWETVARIEVLTETRRLKAAVESSILSFKAKKIEQLIAGNQQKLKEAEQSENYEILSEILKRQQELKNISKLINNKLGRVITR
ncbi:MAG: DNA primase [Bacteroidales bacterium]|nr:DNA primase [Bacteroidales bacterium]